MSLKKYIELATHRFASQLQASAKEVAVMEFSCPCKLCNGTKNLVATTSFSVMGSHSEPLKKTSGEIIYSKELIPCPACMGTGIDSEELAKKVAAA